MSFTALRCTAYHMQSVATFITVPFVCVAIFQTQRLRRRARLLCCKVDLKLDGEVSCMASNLLGRVNLFVQL